MDTRLLPAAYAWHHRDRLAVTINMTIFGKGPILGLTNVIECHRRSAVNNFIQNHFFQSRLNIYRSINNVLQ
jgi:hypothetical protein